MCMCTDRREEHEHRRVGERRDHDLSEARIAGRREAVGDEHEGDEQRAQEQGGAHVRRDAQEEVVLGGGGAGEDDDE